MLYVNLFTEGGALVEKPLTPPSSTRCAHTTPVRIGPAHRLEEPDRL